MKKRLMDRETSARAWRYTPEFTAKYAILKAAAQARADATGYDVGIEVFDTTKTVHMFGLPQRWNRFGRDAVCEVVVCSDMSKCMPGHGP